MANYNYCTVICSNAESLGLRCNNLPQERTNQDRFPVHFLAQSHLTANLSHRFLPGEDVGVEAGVVLAEVEPPVHQDVALQRAAVLC